MKWYRIRVTRVTWEKSITEYTPASGNVEMVFSEATNG